jgi:hypothetical protein
VLEHVHPKQLIGPVIEDGVEDEDNDQDAGNEAGAATTPLWRRGADEAHTPTQAETVQHDHNDGDEERRLV